MKRILCLPVAGEGNPYQKLMMDGLRKRGLYVTHGENVKVFPILRSLISRNVDVIHFDWIHQYYLTRFTCFLWLRGGMFMVDQTLSKLLFRRVKWVWTVHNTYPHSRGKMLYDRLMRSVFALNCSIIRVFSEDSKNVIVKEFGILNTKIRVIPEGNYIDYYESIESRPLDIDKRNFTCLYLGQIKAYKGVDDLISVAKECKYEDIHFIIAGKVMESNLTWLEKEAEGLKNVTFHNSFIQESELHSFYAAADVVILPFKSILNSGSAIMAMGFAKPIIAPSKGVLKDRLKQQKQLLYTDGNLKTTIKYARSLSSLSLAEIGKRNYEAALVNSWEDFGSIFLD